MIKEMWEEYDIDFFFVVSDGEWCCCVFLDIFGWVFIIDELDEFLGDCNVLKCEVLVNCLFYDEEYIEEYVCNWIMIWINILIGCSGGSE